MPMLWLPAASRDPRGGFPWQVDCPTKGILHTTEGASWPDYPPRYHPHATVLPRPGKGVDVRQHVPFDQASYALKHDSGAPTNGAHALQFELVGTCDPGGPKGAYYWPDADDAVLRDLYAKVIKPVNDAHGVKLQAPAWKPYPASYGDNGVRFASDAAWLAWNGWCGHEHVRGGNNHGDPGAFPWARLTHSTQKEDDMPLTADDAALVARAVHNQLLFGSDVSIGKAVFDTYRRPVPAIPTAADIAAVIVAQFKTLPAGTATLADADVARIATKVADELSTRLVK